jgi:hypothetical protein
VARWLDDGREVDLDHRDAVFEIADGRIDQMREAYDLQSVLDQMKAAGEEPPEPSAPN